MTYSLEWIKEQGEEVGNQLFNSLKIDSRFKNLTYPDFVLLMDFMYAKMFDRVYEDTYRKQRNPHQCNWKLGEARSTLSNGLSTDGSGHKSDCSRTQVKMRTTEDKLICLECHEVIKE